MKYIDITPTWSAVLPILLGVLENKKAPAASRKAALEELERMARLADQCLSTIKINEAKQEG